MNKLGFLLATICCARALSAADQRQTITITAGHSVVLDTPADIERVSVATEDIVEAVAMTQREIVLNGKAPGETTVIVWQKNGAGRTSYDVTVEPSQLKLESLRRTLKRETGDSVQADMEDKSIVLRGSVKTQADGDHAIALASAFGKTINLMTIATPPAESQVLLKVRFADVDRSASLSLGANLFSTGAAKTPGSISTQQFSAPTPKQFDQNNSQFNLSNALNVFLFRPDLNLGATIEALQAKNLVQILAEPNVLAINGKEASFLAGGEFPYPVVQSSTAGVNNVTIMFREFGIRLRFTPTVTPRGTIRLEVEPEVSALDYGNGLAYGGFTIPGLSVRRIKTEIEIQDNQSFAIAGLLDNRLTENFSKVPGIGDIPVLGKLFQSKTTNRTNSELLVVVTPELVQPIPAGSPVPTIEMPKPFLKVDPANVNGANPADTRPLTIQPQVPFQASAADSDKKTDAPAVSASATGVMLPSIKANK